MTGFHDKNGILHADDIALTDIAQKYETPTYVYSASKIKDTIARLQAAFRDTLPADRQPLVAFACKANSNIAVIRLAATMGLGADIVSGGEMIRALKAGIAPEKIVFSGVGKTREEIIAALNAGVGQINVESKPELEAIAAIAAEKKVKAPVALRINPDVDAKTHAKITTGKTENKFGISPAEAEALYRWAAAHPHLRPRGFSLHIGSQLTTLEPFAEAFRKLADLARRLKNDGLPLETLDLGGGLGVLYRDVGTPDLRAYAEIVRDTIAPLDVQIILEPGRLLVGEAGILLTRVIYVKQGEKRRYLIVDAGMNDLMRPALYDAWHTIRPVVTKAGASVHSYDVVGPVCETGDTFAKERELPEMAAGDLAAFMTGGAYGYAMASNYNTRGMPAEILVEGDKIALISKRQTVENILEREEIPGWLG